MLNEDMFFDKMRKLKKEYDLLLIEHPELHNLTDRELFVLEKMLSDKILAEIAEELNLTRSGVHFHCKNIYKKLGVHSRTQLLVAYKNYFNGGSFQNEKKRFIHSLLIADSVFITCRLQ